jgi:polyhydroxybutyrate depolymerase
MSPGEASSPPPASTSTSENPVSPDLTLNPESSGASGPDGEGVGSEPGAADPEDAPAGGEMAGGDPSAQPEPSVMCGGGGASPSFDLPNTLFSVPDAYDGNTPLPVVIAFHAAGNENTQLRGILGNTLQDDFIMLYPKSDGNGWSNGPDAPKVDAIFDALDATACYDKRRVFATGHSSGAQFIVQRLCAGETRWRAVAPVASSVYCSSWEPIPALVIHGIGDVERRAYGLDDGDGLKDIVPYRTSNGCQETYTEVPVDGCNSGGVQVDPGCRDFDGCGERTRWCQHNDPQYGTSHHGVPCFGARVIQQFFAAYR